MCGVGGCGSPGRTLAQTLPVGDSTPSSPRSQRPFLWSLGLGHRAPRSDLRFVRASPVGFSLRARLSGRIFVSCALTACMKANYSRNLRTKRISSRLPPHQTQSWLTPPSGKEAETPSDLIIKGQTQSLWADVLLLAFLDRRRNRRPRVAFLGFYVGVAAFLEIGVRVARFPWNRRPRGWIPPVLRSRGKNRPANVNQGTKNHANVDPIERLPRQRRSRGTPATPTSISGNACHGNVDPMERPAGLVRRTPL